MTARTHDILAFSSLIIVSVYFPPPVLGLPTLFASLVACVIGSLFPDMDQASNRLWDLLPAGDILGRVFRKVFLGHRTLSHSLLGIYLIYKLTEWLFPLFLNPSLINPQIVQQAFMVGMVSHLVADSLTEEGLPLFFPFLIKVGFPPIKPWRIKTGGWFEKLVVFPGTIVLLFLFILNHRPEISALLRMVR